MTEYLVCVVSKDNELVQLIKTSLSSTPEDHQAHPRFNVIHSPEAELSTFLEIKDIHALILDNHLNPDLCNHVISRGAKFPIISIDKPTQDSSSPKEDVDNTQITRADLSNSLFPLLLTKIMSEFKISQTLESSESKLNREINNLQSIRQSSLHFTKNLSLDEVLNGILQAALDISGADDSVIFLYEHGILDQGLVWNFDNDITSPLPSKQLKDNFYIVSKGGEIKLAENYSINPIFIYPDFQGSIYDIELIVNNSNIGSMTIGFREGHHFTADEKRILQMLADQAAIAIENARLFKIANAVAVVSERTRIARELHDSIAQSLYGIALYAKASLRKFPESKANSISDHLATVQKIALDALKEMRLMLFSLRPALLDREGLIPALIARLESVEEKSGVSVDFTIEGNPVLPEDVEDAFYRIAQEALNNILKHAQASNIIIRLKNKTSGIELIIRDNGSGFSIDQPNITRGLGIPGMKERAGQIGGNLKISSDPGKGTTIQVEVPHE